MSSPEKNSKSLICCCVVATFTGKILGVKLSPNMAHVVRLRGKERLRYMFFLHAAVFLHAVANEYGGKVHAEH